MGWCKIEHHIIYYFVIYHFFIHFVHTICFAVWVIYISGAKIGKIKSLPCIDDVFHLNIARMRGSRKAMASSAVKYSFCGTAPPLFYSFCGTAPPLFSETNGICLGSWVFIII